MLITVCGLTVTVHHQYYVTVTAACRLGQAA